MAYVDVDDIKEHFRAAGALEDDAIEEVMDEQEDYVAARLRMTTLPPNNSILKSIIRNLTVAEATLNLLPPGSADIEKALAMRNEGLRRLEEVREDGTGIRVPGSSGPGQWENEVLNPYETPFFTWDDFLP